MGVDVFNRQQLVLADVWTADGAQLTFAGANFGVGMLTQQASWNYGQPLSRFYEVGSNNTYMIVGRPRGQCSLNRIVGPNAMVAAFYAAYGDACNAQGNLIDLTVSQDSCQTNSSGNALSYGLYSPIITNLGGGVAAENMVIQENVAMEFVSMTVNQNVAAGAGFPGAGGGGVGGGGGLGLPGLAGGVLGALLGG